MALILGAWTVVEQSLPTAWRTPALSFGERNPFAPLHCWTRLHLQAPLKPLRVSSLVLHQCLAPFQPEGRKQLHCGFLGASMLARCRRGTRGRSSAPPQPALFCWRQGRWRGRVRRSAVLLRGLACVLESSSS